MKKQLKLSILGAALGVSALSFFTSVSEAQVIRIPFVMGASSATDQVYDFGDVQVGQYVTTTFQYKNSTGGPLGIVDSTAEGVDLIGTDCPSVLSAQGTCNITIGFLVTADGYNQGAVKINTDKGSQPDVLTVKANGVTSGQILTVNPAAKQYTVLNQEETFTISNEKNYDISVSNVMMSNNYWSVTSTNCVGKLAAGSTCKATAKYINKKTGSYSGTLKIISQSVTVGASALTGNTSLGVATFTSNDITAQDLKVNQVYTDSVVLKNTGAGSMTVTNVGLDLSSSSFSIVNNACTGASLAPQATCSVDFKIVFSSPSVLQRALVFTLGNASSSSASLNVYASATSATSLLSVTPTSVTFPDQVVGGTSPAQQILIKSIGNTPVSVSNINLSGADAGLFNITNKADCIGTLSPDQQCTLNITYGGATKAGTNASTLSFTSNVTTPAPTVALKGVSVAPTITASPSPVTFTGNVGTDYFQNVAISNTSTVSTTLKSISINNPNMVLDGSSCVANSVIPAGGSCALKITLSKTTPSGSGAASVTISHTGTNLAIPVSYNLTPLKNDPVVSEVSCPTVSTSTLATSPVTTKGLDSCTLSVTNTSATAPLYVPVNGVSKDKTGSATFNTNADEVGAVTTIAPGATVVFNIGHQIPTTAGTNSSLINVTTTPVLNSTDFTFSIQKNASYTAINPAFEVSSIGCGASAPLGGTVSCYFRINNKSLSKYSIIQPLTAKKSVYMGAKFSEIKLNGSLLSSQITEKPVDDYSPTASQFKWTLMIANCSSGSSTATTGIAASDFCEGILFFTPTKVGTYDIPVYLVPGVGSPVKANLNASFTITDVASGSLSAVTCPPLSVGAKGACTATLTNPATSSALAISSIAVAGEPSGTFGVATSTCGTSLAAKGVCNISIPVTGTSAGSFNTVLTATTSAGTYTSNASITVSTATPSLVLGNFACPATTQGVAVTCTASLKNTGSVAYNITGANVVNKTAGFGTVTPKDTSVLPGATTTLSLPFTNDAAGTFTSVVTVSASGYLDASTNATAVVSPAPAAVATLSPLTCGSLYFSQSGLCVATLKNTSAIKPVAIKSIGATGSVAGTVGTVSSNCGVSLDANASCTITVPVTGVSTLSSVVTLTVASNPPFLVQRATLNVAPLVFSVVQAPDASGSINTAVVSRTGFVNKNSFKVTLPATAITVGPQMFKIVKNDCINIELAPEQTCYIETSATSTAAGILNGLLTLKHGGANVVGNVKVAFTVPTLTVAPFAGTTTKEEGFRSLSGDWYVVSNPNAVPVTLSSIAMTNANSVAVADKNVPGACFIGKVLSPGESCNVFERFNITGMTKTSQLNTNTGNVRTSTSVSAAWASKWTTMRGTAVFDTASGATYVGGVYSGVVKFTNTATTGVKDVTLIRNGAVTATSPIFNIVDSTCSSIVVPGGTCNIKFEVSNLKAGLNTVAVDVSGDYQTIVNGKPSGSWGEQTVVATVGTLSINVSTPTATVTAGAYGNSSIAVNKFTNTSTYPLYVTSVDVSGAADQYLSGTTCLNNWIAPKATCDVTTTRQLQTGDLAIVRTPAKITVTAFNAYPFSATLTISPVLTNAVNFGTVNYGSSSSKAVPLYNGGSTPWVVSSVVLPDSVKRISTGATDCPVTVGFTLPAGQKCDMRLSWSPANEGIFDDVMKINNNWTGQPVINVNLTGNAVIPVGTKIVPKVTGFCPVNMPIYDPVRKEIVTIAGTSLGASPASTLDGTTVNPGLYFAGHIENGLGMTNCRYLDVTPKGAVEPTLSYSGYFSTSNSDYTASQIGYVPSSETFVLVQLRQPPNTNGWNYTTPPIRHTLTFKQRGGVRRYLVNYDPFVKLGTYYSSMYIIPSYDHSVSYLRFYEGSTGLLQVYRINTSSAAGVDLLPAAPFYSPGSGVSTGTFTDPLKMLGAASFNMVDSTDKNLIWGQLINYGIFTYNVQTGEIIRRVAAAGGANNVEYGRFATALTTRAMTSDGIMYGLAGDYTGYTLYSLDSVTKEYKTIASYPQKAWALTNASIAKVMVDSTQKYLIVVGNGYLEKVRIKP